MSGLAKPYLTSDDVGVPGGVAGPLDENGQVPIEEIPDAALPQVYPVANAAARLALTVQEGDEAIQTDNGSHWVYDGTTWYLRPGSGATANLSPFNKGMVATVTTSDNNLACTAALVATPPLNAWILVMVNGVEYKVGNGTKVSVPCYFSGDGGVTARATGGLATGDLLYWNGSASGFQLDAFDRIDFIFEAL